MRKLAGASVMCAAALFAAAQAYAATSVSLDFNGSGSTLAATGFDNVYTLDASGFSVGGGALTINTLPGDTFGNYENDPDSAKNMFYSNVDPLQVTVVEARVHVNGLNVNFHGGGIWMGTDQDHYVRMGVFHNSFLASPPVGIEVLRENEDRWGGATPPGQGDDIVSNATGLGATQPVDVVLRLVRDGNNVTGYYSLNNGATFLPGGSFGGLALPGDPQGLGSNTIENTAANPLLGLKVGVYAFGGPDGSTPATFAFDSFTANSFVPEPATATVLCGLGAMTLARGRRRSR